MNKFTKTELLTTCVVETALLMYEGSMFSWLRMLLGREDAAASLLRRAKRAQDMLDAAGVQVLDTRAELKKATAIVDALGALKLPRNEAGRLNPEMSHAVMSALRKYRENMVSALSIVTYGRADATSRDTEIFKARHLLVSSLPVIINPIIIADIDQKLGLPPISSEIGLDSP